MDEIKKMTNEAILRRQLELLAKDSENLTGNELATVTHAMVDVLKSMNLENYISRYSL